MNPIKPIREGRETLKILGSAEVVTQAPTKRLGIVSPCSSCNNHYDSVSEGDVVHVPCPRLQWIARLKQQDPDLPPAYPSYLSLTGTSGNSLANPVYSTDDSTVFTWVAVEDHNQGVLDENGNQVAPDLLDPSFNVSQHSEYLRCELLPFVLDKTQAELYNNGVLHESDRIYAEEFSQQQMDMSGMQSFVAGTITKATLPFSFSLKTPLRDNCPSGC
jgi:hypothetical protein